MPATAAVPGAFANSTRRAYSARALFKISLLGRPSAQEALGFGYNSGVADGCKHLQRLMKHGTNRDLPEVLSFFAFPRHLGRNLRTTNVIERCFVEVRRRARLMVWFVNVESVDHIIYSTMQRFNLEWKNRVLSVFTRAA